jgi:hypothetical protein
MDRQANYLHHVATKILGRQYANMHFETKTSLGKNVMKVNKLFDYYFLCGFETMVRVKKPEGILFVSKISRRGHQKR